ncbi:TetR family transcriptional regulator [Kineococcus aurantiacus]|uniref:AcrR family transcriptional regulator n=1 Tax=Kineococcus aurantiacus TaxID=37633 RepID=A0A7Y9DLS6_9ACTN|nr:AcrR family transcriptional regulator [Kineococcus aurantiacus]
MDQRTAILDAAERLLAASEDHDVATRAVCEAAGVTQPVLYRQFGDKKGLLDALADRGFERYAHRKAGLPVTDDPVADLLSGWDDHTRFAAANPALYQLMFVPRPRSRSVARQRVLDLLAATLTRVAAAGRLTVEVDHAAQVVLSANVGAALNRIAQPEVFGEDLSHRVRDAVFGSLLRDAPRREGRPGLPSAARRLRAQLDLTDPGTLEPEETALLRRWLERLS